MIVQEEVFLNNLKSCIWGIILGGFLTSTLLSVYFPAESVTIYKSPGDKMSTDGFTYFKYLIHIILKLININYFSTYILILICY